MTSKKKQKLPDGDKRKRDAGKRGSVSAAKKRTMETQKSRNRALRLTKATALKIVTDGEITPLEVMAEAMRYHYQKYLNEPDEGDIVTVSEEFSGDGSKARPHKMRNQKEYHLRCAVAYATDAAPYLHHKLASIEMTGKNGSPLFAKPIEELTAEEAMQRYKEEVGSY